jgi:eukaryotic-like serine/threonine-protein kinase
MILERGARLNNRYKIIEILGQGGMGSVYRALDENLGVQVAVKDNLFTTDEYARQFRLEAVILANLRHPNLPRVTDHFVIPSQGQYLVMDYIEGEDLRQRMDRIGLIPEDDAILIGAAICDALTYLHTRSPQVIHRDIKPGNVKITPQGHIYLVDFGLAKVVIGGEATTTGARAMTPGYSPPEQYGTARTDTRTDIFSLGATLYAALTGQVAEDALARAMDQANLTPIRQHNPRLGKRTASVIEKALSVRPDERYQSAEEFKNALLSARWGTRSRPNEFSVEPPPLSELGHVVEQEARSMLAEERTPGSYSPLSPGRSVRSLSPEPAGPNEGAQFDSYEPFTGQALSAGLPPLALDEPAPLSMLPGLTFQDSQPSPRHFRRRDVLRGCWTMVVAVILLGIVVGAGFYISDPSLASRAVAWMLPAVLSTEPLASPTPTLPPSPSATRPPTRTLTPTLESTAAAVILTDTPTPSATPTAQPTPQGGSGQLAFASDRSGTVQIYLMDVASGEVQPITNLEDGACQPSWSPDGERLVFISPCSGNSETYPGAAMFIINADGSGLTLLPSSPGGDFDPSWSPDGQFILFSSVRDGSIPRLYLYHLADGTVERLSQKDRRDQMGTWSPDGQTIAFVTTRDGPMRIYLMNADGTEQRPFSASGSKLNLWPTWSPDGKVLMFTQKAKANSLPMLIATTLSRESVHIEVRVTQDNSPMREGRYSPDGYWIAYEQWADDRDREVYLMTANGTTRTNLSSSPSLDFDPAWRPLR